MSDLDDKLREILDGNFGADYSDAIAQIKQAFAEHYDAIEKDTLHYVSNLKLMTGQEWYERFEHELATPPKSGFTTERVDIFQRAKEAAKRAAGIV